MSTSKNLIFFGNERLSTGYSPNGAPTLEAIIHAGYNVVAVVANYEAGTSRKARKLEVAEVAKAHNIPVLLPNKLSEIKDQLAAYNPTAAVLVAYGKIIPQSIIDLFPNGIVNIHPSLLPLYRGSTPIEQAILDGVPQTGVSLMQIVRAMDAGPLYAQTTVTLHGNETKFELTDKLLKLGGELVLQVLPSVMQGTAQLTTQDETQATFTPQISKADGVLDLNKPAEQLEREIRAYAGWPKSRLDVYNNSIIVTKARIAQSSDDGDLVIACNPGWLEILELVAPSGRTISGADFARGYRKSS